MEIKTMANMAAEGKSPEVLFWVGCAGSFDERAQKTTKAMAKILTHAGIDYAILGKEESCTGDPAKRAGNEFLFQMQATTNIAVLNGYNIKKIVTTCPHCFNTLKNEYPSLGGNYEVIHHTTFLQSLIDDGKIKFKGGVFKGEKITYHDSCYLGRANNIYESPRKVLEALDFELTEMKSCKQNGMCCGAGGAQMFKDAEKGSDEIFNVRSKQVIATGVKKVAVNCPFCTTMIQDGIKKSNKEDAIKVLDLAELVAKAADL